MKILIIEDEILAAERLSDLIRKYDSGIQILDTLDSVRESVNWFNNNSAPDLCFMDIQLADGLSFDIFEKTSVECPIIFTTAYDEYAIRAFKVNSIDYLLKPIDLEELRNALQKMLEKKLFEESRQKMQVLKENLNNVLKKLALPTSEGFIFVEITDILRCEASGNYTMFYFKGGSKTLVSKTLKTFEEILGDFNFFRINRSNLINLNHITKYGRQKNATITMVDGSILSLAERRKEDFLKQFENI